MLIVPEFNACQCAAQNGPTFMDFSLAVTHLSDLVSSFVTVRFVSLNRIFIFLRKGSRLLLGYSVPNSGRFPYLVPRFRALKTVGSLATQGKLHRHQSSNIQLAEPENTREGFGHC